MDKIDESTINMVNHRRPFFPTNQTVVGDKISTVGRWPVLTKRSNVHN